MHSLKTWSLITATAALLAACGGGESGLASPPNAVALALQSTASTAVDAALCTDNAVATGAYRWVGEQCTLASALLTASAAASTTTTATATKAQASAVSSRATAAAAIDATAFFDWAEGNFPTLFPGHKSNLATGSFAYRYYPETQIALGVSDGKVYGLGPVTGNVLALLGNLSDFTCRVSPSLCAAPGTPSTGAVSTAGVACGYNYSAVNTSTLGALTSTSSWVCNGTARVLAANGVPDHAVGTFPNSNNPNTITVQSVAASYTLAPTYSGTATTMGGAAGTTGYVLNGVKIDAGTAGTCPANASTSSSCSLIGNSGAWSIEALTQTVFKFGADINNAHVQPGGQYHYHGMPEGFITLRGGGPTKMTLIGWAADGFPIYARYGYSVAANASSALKVMTGSYKLKTTISATRPTTTVAPLGTFAQDWEYVAGSGDLDECNGRSGVTPEFPAGTYHYFATDSYPFLQRCVKGTVTTTGGGTPPPRG
ncbi:MAG: hypothetical protein CFE43_10395 [Burkholderiales bacterium PBB3]|nr:MAG: hypothetical protein CFE43_10395 [Burkholderiales bacterium PBB3]